MYDFSDFRGPCKIYPSKDGSLLNTIRTHGDFTFFNKLVKVSNLEILLDSDQFNSTILVPSDMFLNDDVFSILDTIDASKADSIIHSMTLPNKIISSILEDSPTLYFITKSKTERIYVNNVNNRTYVSLNERFDYNNTPSIIHKDMSCTNGIIHVIDGVFLQNVFL
jgi:hypothetical protein